MSTIIKSELIALTIILLASARPAMSQELSQVDITQGMAEQSAMHVMNTGLVPQQPLQGFAAQNNMQLQQQQSMQQGTANQYGSTSGQNFGNNNGQNFNNNQCYGNQGQNNGQNFNNNQQLQGSMQQNCNNNNNSCNNNYGNGGNGQYGGGGDTIFGVNKQMVGVLGAALLMNYATNGGIANVMGEMRGRGFNNRFRGFGPSIGGH